MLETSLVGNVHLRAMVAASVARHFTELILAGSVDFCARGGSQAARPVTRLLPLSRLCMSLATSSFRFHGGPAMDVGSASPPHRPVGLGFRD